MPLPAVTVTFDSVALPRKPKNEMSCWFAEPAVLLLFSTVFDTVKFVLMTPAPFDGFVEIALERFVDSEQLSINNPSKDGIAEATRIAMLFVLNVPPVMATSLMLNRLLNAIPEPWLLLELTFAKVK